MARHVWLLAALVACTPASAAAQDALTLDRAVQAVLAQNARLAAARAEAGAARAIADETASAMYPLVSVSESWQRSNEPVFVFGSILSARRFALSNFAPDALNHPPSTAAFRTTIAVDQIVFDGGRQRAADRAARRQADAADWLVQVRAADLAMAATGTFGRILTAQAAARAAEAGLSAAREDRARAERRRDAGLATDADVLALGVQVADFERRRIQAAGDASVATAELNRLMGDAIEREWLAVDANAAVEDGAPLPPLASLLAEADGRPDLQRAAALEDAARQAERVASRVLVPRASVQAGFDAAGTEFTHRASAWIAGGVLRWTFSAGGGEQAHRRAAAHDAARARAESEDARAGVRVDVVTAYRRLETARLQRAAARAAVDQARESQRIVRDRFDAGMAGVNDVLRAATDLLDAQSNDVAASVDALVAAAALRRAVGRTP